MYIPPIKLVEFIQSIKQWVFLFAIAIRQRLRPNIIATFNGELCGSYREACQHLQLLENDHHWDQTLSDAVISSEAHQI